MSVFKVLPVSVEEVMCRGPPADYNTSLDQLVFSNTDAGSSPIARAVFLAVSAIAIIVATIFIRYPSNAIGTRPRPDLDGPRGHPIIGNLLWAIKNKDPLRWQVWAQEKFGNGYTVTLPGLGRLIDVSKPEWIEHVQKTNFTNYVKGDSFRHQMKDVLGHGIFTADGEHWKTQRKIAAKIFTVNRFKECITSVIREDTALIDGILAAKAKTGEVFNMQDLYFRFTLSSFVKIAFSQDTGALSNPDVPDEFGEAFGFAQKVLDQRFVQPFWWFTERYSKTGAKMRASSKIIDDFLNDIVSKRLAEAQAGSSKPDDEETKSRGQDLLDLFIAYRNRDGSALGHQDLRDAILNLLIAGRDTTAEALSWMTWHIITDPETHHFLTTEIDEGYDATGSLDIDYGDFKEHSRKLACIHESLRLHPSIPKNIRVAQADDVLPNGGPRIDKGDIVIYSDWAMGRNKDVWGDDAAEFRPSRWIDDDGQFYRVSANKAHFFSAGPRACLGSTLAQFEISQVINSVFGKYNVELVDLGPRKSATANAVPDYLNSLTHPMKRPLMVRVSARS